MKNHWNHQAHKEHFERVMEYAKIAGLSDEALRGLSLDGINEHRSQHVRNAVKIAYWRGILRGIQEADDIHTPVVGQKLEG